MGPYKWIANPTGTPVGSRRRDHGGDSTTAVTSTTVAHPTTQQILVFSPDESGSWPVVMMMHGLNGVNTDMAELSRRVAGGGNVVFAPTWRTDIATSEGATNAARDAECAYRYSRTIASDYHGDLDKPVTFVGWSLGAALVLSQGLSGQIDAMASRWAASATSRGRTSSSRSLAATTSTKATSSTSTRPASPTRTRRSHSSQARTTRRARRGRRRRLVRRSRRPDVDVVILPGANHYAPVFHDHVDGEWVVVPDSAAAEKTVQVILDAIQAAGR